MYFPIRGSVTLQPIPVQHPTLIMLWPDDGAILYGDTIEASFKLLLPRNLAMRSTPSQLCLRTTKLPSPSFEQQQQYIRSGHDSYQACFNIVLDWSIDDDVVTTRNENGTTDPAEVSPSGNTRASICVIPNIPLILLHIHRRFTSWMLISRSNLYRMMDFIMSILN